MGEARVLCLVPRRREAEVVRVGDNFAGTHRTRNPQLSLSLSLEGSRAKAKSRPRMVFAAMHSTAVLRLRATAGSQTRGVATSAPARLLRARTRPARLASRVAAHPIAFGAACPRSRRQDRDKRLPHLTPHSPLLQPCVISPARLPRR